MKMNWAFILLLFPLFSLGSDLSCPEARQILSNSLISHYSVNEVDERFIENVVLNYVEEQDKTKILVTQDEFETIKKDIKKNKGLYLKMFMTQREVLFRTQFGLLNFSNDNCAFLFKAYEAITKGRERYERIFNEVKLDDKTKESVSKIEIKNKRFKNEKSLEKDLKHFFYFKKQNDDLSDIDNFLKAKKKKNKSYNEEFINAVLQVMDPHSGYIDGESLKDFKTAMSSSLDGFGFVITKNKKTKTILVLKVFKDSPISKTIITAGDEIIEINGKPVEKMTLEDFQDELKDSDLDNKNDFKVKSYIDKKNFPEDFDIVQVSVSRGKFNQEKISHSIERKENKLFLKIKLNDFYNDCAEDFKDHYLNAKSEYPNIDGVIVDLRDNLGGNVDDVLKISNLFLGRKLILQTENKEYDLTEKSYSSNNIMDFYPLIKEPLIVLTNSRSASASEILAGTIKIYNRGLIIGDDHTFGKGSIQLLHSFESFNLGYLKLTKNLYFLANGESPQFYGIKSDIVIPSPTRFNDFGEKKIKYSIKPKKKLKNEIDSDFKLVNKTLISKLKKTSQKRIKLNKKFDSFKDKKSIEKWSEQFTLDSDEPEDIVFLESLDVFSDYIRTLNDYQPK